MVSTIAALIFAQAGVAVEVRVPEPEVTVAQQLLVEIILTTTAQSGIRRAIHW